MSVSLGTPPDRDRSTGSRQRPRSRAGRDPSPSGGADRAAPRSGAPEWVGIVVAAGRGERFGGAIPKQFLEIRGASLVARAVRALASRPAVDGVVVVLPPEEMEGPRAEPIRALAKVRTLVAGGPTRAASVLRGLRAAGAARHVLVHDAVRPLASAALVDRVIEATRRHGAAVPVVPIVDTVREVAADGFVVRTLERELLRSAQTPQGARADWLRDALERAEREGVSVTDDAWALERAGHPVFAVAGEPENLKITSPADMAEARRRLGEAGADLRIGTGFDIHRFGSPRPLVLGGVAFPGEPGLEGHSDADAVLHAAMDAMLGAAALGDIGAHFPPGDARFAGISSVELARRVCALVAQAGWALVNLDLTVLAERPRLRERADSMREAIARCFGIDAGQVGLKATTLEGLGALGRAEGVACQAVALLCRRGEPS